MAGTVGSLCDSCVHQQLVRNTRGSVFSLCRRSREEPGLFPKYPRLPVLECVGFEPVSLTENTTAERPASALTGPTGAVTVTALSITAIKGTRLRTVDQIVLGHDGAAGDRRFFLVDDRERMVNGKVLPALQTVASSFDEDSRQLTLRFQDGRVVEGIVDDPGDLDVQPYGDFRPGAEVAGPWAEALSELVGSRLRLIATRSAVDRGTKGAASLVSRGSLARLAREAGVDSVDARRFRMLVEVDGLEPNAEDAWVGRDVEVGHALLHFEGHVGRCLVTSRDPESGRITLPTLDLLRAYRGELDTSEPLAFGIHGRVLRGGVVRIGDQVRVGDTPLVGDTALVGDTPLVGDTARVGETVRVEQTVRSDNAVPPE